jgi:hypothetical protein
LINGNGQWGLSMNRFFRIISVGVLTVLVGAISASTRRAIVNAEPLIEVEVYRNSVRVIG